MKMVRHLRELTLGRTAPKFQVRLRAPPQLQLVLPLGDLDTSLESQRLILATQLAEEWTFESDNNVKEGDVADKDYMYFGYWLQEPVKQSDRGRAITNSEPTPVGRTCSRWIKHF